MWKRIKGWPWGTIGVCLLVAPFIIYLVATFPYHVWQSI